MSKYSDKDIAAVKALMPNALALGHGREFFEAMLDAIALAHKIEHGIKPANESEARTMREASGLVELFNARKEKRQ